MVNIETFLTVLSILVVLKFLCRFFSILISERKGGKVFIQVKNAYSKKEIIWLDLSLLWLLVYYSEYIYMIYKTAVMYILPASDFI